MATNLREKIQQKQVTLGIKKTLKKLRQGLLKEVYITKNLTAEVKEQIKRYAEDKVSIIELDFDNEEFGVKSKKPFNISVIGVLA